MIRIKFSKDKITIGSAFEYEDVLAYILLKSLPELFNGEIKLSGKIISGSDFNPTLNRLGLDLEAEQKKDKETGKVQNYICNISNKSPVHIIKSNLLSLIEELHSSCYLLFDFTVYLCSECFSHMILNPETKMYTCASCEKSQKKPNVEFSIKTKGIPPRPTTKQKGVPKSENQKLANKIKFCQVMMENSPEVKQMLLDELTPDFIDEIPIKLKLLELVNNYHINNLILPPKELMKNSKMFRFLTIREGILERILSVDDNSFENTVQFKI